MEEFMKMINEAIQSFDTFMKPAIDGINAVNGVVWGPIMLVLLLGTGVFLTFGLRFLTFMRIPTAFANLWKNRKGDDKADGELSPFNALMTALSATVGVGNIVGVASAILIGGPGALFWMWCTAMVGMATKFSEALLAVRYREITPDGNVVGGPMYYIKNGLGSGWAWLGTAFAIFGAIASFGIGNMTQTNAISGAVQKAFNVDPVITACVLFVLVGAVLLGGVKRIGAVAGKVVPFMALFYILASLLVISLKINLIPSIFMTIIEQAFTPAAAFGASIWVVIRMGVARGVFSNEAGLGSAPIAHATATTKNPMDQALIAMLGTFIDTIVICSMTGFAILASGLFDEGTFTIVGKTLSVTSSGAIIDGGALTATAFDTVLNTITMLPKGTGSVLVAIALSFFAFTTVLGWCVYGERCMIYLFGDKALTPFRIIFTVIVPLGAIAKIDFVWTLSDTFNACMAIPNLIALLMLSPVVFATAKEYRERQAEKVMK